MGKLEELLAKEAELEAKTRRYELEPKDYNFEQREQDLKAYRAERRLSIVQAAVQDGRIRSRQAKTALRLLEAMQEDVGNGQLHGYDDGGNLHEGTLAEMFLQYLADLPPGIPEDENVWLGGDPGRELDRRAKKLASEIQVDYAAAVKAVFREDPALERAYLAGTS